MEREHIVAAVVSAAGGQLTGRVRLQKVMYLLDQLGLKSGFDYEYHHYGPYSADVTSATEDAKAFKLVHEDVGYRASDGARYSIFRTDVPQDVDVKAFGDLGKDDVRRVLGCLQRRSATVLELAATIDWLHRHEEVADWRTELIQRKGVKTRGGRLEQAVEVLNELGLSPPEST